MAHTIDAVSVDAKSAEASIFADVAAGRKRRLVVVFHAAAIEAEAGPDFAAAAAATSGGNISPAALDDLSAQRAQLYAAAKREILSASAVTAGATISKDYSHLPIAVVSVSSGAALEALRADPKVASVLPERAFTAALSSTLPYIGQPVAAAAGAAGSGCAIAVLDTGCEYTRPAFGNCANGPGSAGCRVVYARDFAPEDGMMDDPAVGQHGTNTAGIVAGVAPSANIIALDVFDGYYAYESNLIAAINWVIANRAKYNICSINFSLGGGGSASTCPDDSTSQALTSLRQAGVLAAVASGNSGFKDQLNYPACSPAAVSVGAVYDVDLGAMNWGDCVDSPAAQGAVACWSNSARFLTLLAPGVQVVAAGIDMTGTSQAAPHVAGAIAVLKSASPSASPDQIVAWLTKTGTRATDPLNGVVTPALNLGAAVQAAKSASSLAQLSDTVPPTGTVVANGGRTTTNSTSVRLDITGSDPSGVASMCVSEDTPTCSAWEPFAAVKTYTLASTTRGTRVIYVSLKDGVDNAMTTPLSASFVFDTTLPTMGSIAGTLYPSFAVLTWSPAVDTVSGIASYLLVSSTTMPPQFCRSGTPTAITQPGRATVTRLAPSTTYYFRLCATDQAGNTAGGAVVTAKTPKSGVGAASADLLPAPEPASTASVAAEVVSSDSKEADTSTTASAVMTGDRIDAPANTGVEAAAAGVDASREAGSSVTNDGTVAAADAGVAAAEPEALATAAESAGDAAVAAAGTAPEASVVSVDTSAAGGAAESTLAADAYTSSVPAPIGGTRRRLSASL